MVPSRRRVISSVAACLLVLVGAGSSMAAAPAPLQYKMGGGPAGGGGVFNILGAAISNVAQKAVPGLTMTTVASQGSAENVIRTSRGEFQFALAGNDTAYQGYQGAKGFPGKMQDFRVVMSGHRAYVHLLLPGDSPVKSWSDLKGKKIGLTSPASPNYLAAAAVLEQHGIQQSDYSPQWINSSQYADAMRNGTVHAAAIQTGYPAPVGQELCTARVGLRLLPVPADVAKAVSQVHPYFTPTVIPAGVYPCVKDEVPTMYATAFLIAHKGTPDDVVYAVLERIVEQGELAQVHAAGKAWVLEGALAGRAGLPLHPGAERYFREKGLLK